MSDFRVYRPSIFVRMQIRLEDYLPPDQSKGASEADTTAVQSHALVNKQKAANKRADLQAAAKDPVGAARSRREALKFGRQAEAMSSKSPKARPKDESPGDIYSVDLYIVPTEASIEVNTYKSLDTCSFSFPFRDAPLEAQDIRSALIEVYLGTVPPENFATPDRWRLSLQASKILFRGYVDDWGTTHDDSTSKVDVKARSLESILVDAEVDSRSSIFKVKSGGEKISDFVTRVISNVPAASGAGGTLKSVYFPGLNADTALEPVLDNKSLLRVLQSAKSRNQAAGNPQAGPPQAQTEAQPPEGGTDPANVEGGGDTRLPPASPPSTSGGKISAWDVIIQACSIVGMIPVYDPSLALKVVDLFNKRHPIDEQGGGAQELSDFILIRPPQTIFGDTEQDTKVVGGPIDGFRRQLPDAAHNSTALVPSEIRLLVWGRNIKSITTSKKLGRLKVPSVEVRGYNMDAAASGRAISVKFPKLKGRVTKIGPKGDGESEEVVRRIVNGVRSLKQLMQIAVGLYHALGRQHIEVTVETQDLSTYIPPGTSVNPNDVPDVLDMRHGTPVRLMIARQVTSVDPGGEITISPLSEVFERDEQTLLKFLVEQRQRFFGAPTNDERARIETMAKRISATIKASRKTDLFFVKSVQHSWSTDKGWAGTITMMNFVEVRDLPKNISKEDFDIDGVLKPKGVVVKKKVGQ